MIAQALRTESGPRIAIVGLGNVLMGDDAVGPYALKVLEALHALPDEVEPIDAGTPGLDLTAYFAGFERLIVLDAVRAKGPPGEVLRFDKQAILGRAPLLAMGPHDPGLREALLNAEFIGVCPEVVSLIGVIPLRVETRVGLSGPVRAAIPQVLEAVLDELGQAGAAVARRDPPATLDIWWERGAAGA
jgi:hydrogenase maturation protease